MAMEERLITKLPGSALFIQMVYWLRAKTRADGKISIQNDICLYNIELN
jgi:hypothetical protein